MRDVLFGDVPIVDWPPAGSESAHLEPRASFVAARTAVGEGRMPDAVARWTAITQMPGLESRHYAQAWHLLRTVGVVPPPERAGELLGVILEVPVDAGHDLLAAYSDRHARYINFSGAGVIWERPNDSLDPLIAALFAAGERVVHAIGAGHKPRPAPPQPNELCMAFVTPAGLAYGRGPFDALSKDPMAAAILTAGAQLMQGLIALADRSDK